MLSSPYIASKPSPQILVNTRRGVVVWEDEVLDDSMVIEPEKAP
jgi:hypothetical protein